MDSCAFRACCNSSEISTNHASARSIVLNSIVINQPQINIQLGLSEPLPGAITKDCDGTARVTVDQRDHSVVDKVVSK